MQDKTFSTYSSEDVSQTSYRFNTFGWSMSFMMTISLSMPNNTLSARAPASDTERREEMICPLGTILMAAYLPVMACLAILTRPGD